MIILVIIAAISTLYAVFITAVWWLQRQRTNDDFQNSNVSAAEHNNVHLQQQYTEAVDKENAASIAMLAKADEAQRLHQTFQKFVPRQFVEHFAKGGADSLALGYADEDEVAIMFCDIRGFTRLSEQMSPQQLMNFLNSYFTRMNAPIHDNFGFIDKFIGDAIMALFDHPNGDISDKATDSVKAALDLQKALRLYNHHRGKVGYEAVRNGIGLHVGPVVLGTVGSDDRMDTTVIGNTVNVAQRIESLTDYFGMDILASKEIVTAASEQTEFAHRTIDNVVLKGKSTSVEIVEIYHHLSVEEVVKREKSKIFLAEGISLRDSRNFKAALAVFIEGQEANPKDTVYKHHINMCETLQHEIEWDGKIRL
jgi:adenylate cyclase